MPFCIFTTGSYSVGSNVPYCRRRLRLGGRGGFVEKIEDKLVQAVAQFKSLGGAGYVAHQDLKIGARGAQSHYRSGAEPA